ncbi:hypothetical protein [Maribellus sediminis]|uniref:hypothetical protein n=1 Tax=Maribellus sediminis TaxID=2696285 RepID=UPI0014320BF9|nr:hypothetical protein [Maribellus sediminis]
MGFIAKANNFFMQLQYDFAISDGFYEVELGFQKAYQPTPEQFVEIIEKYGIDYPFLAGAKIVELKNLAKKDGFTNQEAINLFNELKTTYWTANGVVQLYSPSGVDVLRYLQETRQDIFEQLVESFGRKGAKIELRHVKLFCELCNASGLVSLNDFSSVEKYCEFVLQKYNIDFTIRRVKYFAERVNEIDDIGLAEEVKELILPKIPEPDRMKIQEKIKQAGNFI